MISTSFTYLPLILKTANGFLQKTGFDLLSKSGRWMFNFVLLISLSGVSMGQTTIFSENMGTPTGTTAIASNTFQNTGFAFSGTGDARNTTTSTGYTGSSAGGNVFLTNSGTSTFQIAGISTVGYTTLSVSFGAYKNTTASSMSELTLEYSINGTAYTALTIAPCSQHSLRTPKNFVGLLS